MDIIRALKRKYGANKEEIDAYLEEIKKEYLGILEEDEIDKDECYLTTWDDDKKEVVAVFGTLPKAYDEIYCEAREEGEEHVDNG